MTSLRITNGFEKLSDPNLLTRTSQILNNLDLNFSTAPGLAAMTTARDNFADALSKSIDGGIIEKAIKNQRRQELVDQHHLMIPYVLMTAAGDRVRAIESGYTIAKDPTPRPEVTAPENLKVENGPNAGELLLSFGKVAGARSYVYQSTPEPRTDASVWSMEVGTVRKQLFTGLDTAKRYWIRVAAVGVKGVTVYSEAVLSKIVQ